MIRRPPRSTLSSSSAASDVYKRQWMKSPVDYNKLHAVSLGLVQAAELDTSDVADSSQDDAQELWQASPRLESKSASFADLDTSELWAVSGHGSLSNPSPEPWWTHAAHTFSQLSQGFYRWYMGLHRSRNAFIRSISNHAQDQPSMVQMLESVGLVGWAHTDLTARNTMILKVVGRAAIVHARLDGIRICAGFLRWRQAHQLDLEWTRHQRTNTGDQEPSFEDEMKLLLVDVKRTWQNQLSTAGAADPSAGLQGSQAESQGHDCANGHDNRLTDCSELSACLDLFDQLIGLPAAEPRAQSPAAQVSDERLVRGELGEW
eukprot:TRINITY_DN27429_c0_g1_i1.p1 TRINITY_DN27429_c0_g1~~TRINITY_DN27429_c0_g1_i1.p1  ORF type:complete len:318 (+),score=50.24 TRINITY_DN27429_c0_g1_i1:133-1086(+)